MKSIIDENNQLTKPCILTLSTVSGVDIKLLEIVNIKSQRHNILRLPWYSVIRKGGGGITLGNTIYLTANYFDQGHKYGAFSFGDNSVNSIAQWFLLLSHEVGHLPQSVSFGLNRRGRRRYFYYFTIGYLSRVLKMKFPVHHFSAEIVADLGRYVLKMVFLDVVKKTPNFRGAKLFNAIKQGSLYDVHEVLDDCYHEISIARNEYMSMHWTSFFKVAKKLDHEIFEQNRNAA